MKNWEEMRIWCCIAGIKVREYKKIGSGRTEGSMETCSRKTDNFIRTKGWLLLWHALPVIALLLWGVFSIRNNLWYDEAYSASMVSLPWKRLIYITATDDHRRSTM